ncbi:uncharacterized protein [Amphiura filiformis]|uniref:uncharacterized protein n=1 Tax=Amphiura filiformis TaxID=82378 RepID=UPI003B21ED02
MAARGTDRPSATPKSTDVYLAIGETGRHVHIQILKGDITTEDTQLVVVYRSKDNNTVEGDSLRVLQAAGVGIETEYQNTKAQGGRYVKKGVVMTTAGNLRHPRRILHLLLDDNPRTLRSTILTAFRFAEKQEFQSISFPPLSSQIRFNEEEIESSGGAKRLVLKKMLKCFEEFVQNDEPICLNFIQVVINDPESVHAGQNACALFEVFRLFRNLLLTERYLALAEAEPSKSYVTDTDSTSSPPSLPKSQNSTESQKTSTQKTPKNGNDSDITCSPQSLPKSESQSVTFQKNQIHGHDSDIACRPQSPPKLKESQNTNFQQIQDNGNNTDITHSPQSLSRPSTETQGANRHENQYDDHGDPLRNPIILATGIAVAAGSDKSQSTYQPQEPGNDSDATCSPQSLPKSSESQSVTFQKIQDNGNNTDITRSPHSLSKPSTETQSANCHQNQHCDAHDDLLRNSIFAAGIAVAAASAMSSAKSKSAYEPREHGNDSDATCSTQSLPKSSESQGVTFQKIQDNGSNTDITRSPHSLSKPSTETQSANCHENQYDDHGLLRNSIILTTVRVAESAMLSTKSQSTCPPQEHDFSNECCDDDFGHRYELNRPRPDQNVFRTNSAEQYAAGNSSRITSDRCNYIYTGTGRRNSHDIGAGSNSQLVMLRELSYAALIEIIEVTYLA